MTGRWPIFKWVIVLSLIVPLSIITYHLLFLGKNTVVFLEGYPTALSFLILLYYTLLFLLGVGWLVNQLKLLLALKNEKQRTELLHLQNQVNPHFFFNMLNNLYGVVGKDAEKAKSLILKLSELMRYSIYEGSKDEVQLREEIQYLNSFIELNRIRYHKAIDVQFEVHIDEPGWKVMPLMYIVLLENAFKHGVEGLRENSFVHIELRTSEDEIDFKIQNNFDPTQQQEHPGIGIQNLKRRLTIAYPKRHTLQIHKDEFIFKAFLQIRK